VNIQGFRISVDAGHQFPSVDSGAIGIGNVIEDTLNREVANLVIQKLTTLGANVLDVTPQTAGCLLDSLAQRCDASNAFGAKVHICIHHNAFDGNAHGAETLYVSKQGSKLATAIQNEIIKLGYINRGIKKRKDLYVLNHTIAIVAVITECGFVDSTIDMSLYDPDKESTSIVNGVVNYIAQLK
jgi:N-acetylmuramoyl-L-alanine amidase